MVKEAAKLNIDEYQKFIATVNTLRAKQKRSGTSKKEAGLLEKINHGFPLEKWQRLCHLDTKMEEAKLTGPEYTELTALSKEYEKFCVDCIELLKELALIRNISLEEVMHQIGLKHGTA